MLSQKIKIASSTLLFALYANCKGSCTGDKQDKMWFSTIFSIHFIAIDVGATGLITDS